MYVTTYPLQISSPVHSDFADSPPKWISCRCLHWLMQLSQSCRFPAKSQCIPRGYLLMLTSQSCPTSCNVSLVNTFAASLSIMGPFRHLVHANSTIKWCPQVTMHTPQISPLPWVSCVVVLFTKPPSSPHVIISKWVLLDHFTAIVVSSCIVPLSDAGTYLTKVHLYLSYSNFHDFLSIQYSLQIRLVGCLSGQNCRVV